MWIANYLFLEIFLKNKKEGFSLTDLYSEFLKTQEASRATFYSLLFELRARGILSKNAKKYFFNQKNFSIFANKFSEQENLSFAVSNPKGAAAWALLKKEQ